MNNTPRRLAAENVTLRLRATDVPDAPVHVVDVSIAYDIRDRRGVEIAFVTRGKVGHGLDLMLQDMGLQLSRALQGRDPATGDASPTSALNLSNEAYALVECIAEQAAFDLSLCILTERHRFRAMSPQEKAALIQAIQIEGA